MQVRQARWQRVRELFDAAVALPAAERSAFLTGACADSAESAQLRAEVEALLRADDERHPMFGASLGAVAAGVLAEPVTLAGEIGPYAIVRELGRGGMATVYLARDGKHDRLVALKTLHPFIASSLGTERFRREIAFAARLQHPHVLTLLDSGDSDGRLWYTMPYVEGETLRARLRREGRLRVSEAEHITRQVALALEYAHAHGVAHRDIKPENVLLSGDVAVVADFGVAKALAAAAEPDPASQLSPVDTPEWPNAADSLAVSVALTRVGVVLGTPAYMAPEQARGDSATDHRVDLYALGCLTYEMLAGRPPFVADTPGRLLQAHLDQEPEPLVRHRSDVPAGLAMLVMRCLEKDPADRPAMASDVVAALTDVTAVHAGGAAQDARARVPGDGPQGPSVPRRRHRRTLPLAAALAVVALAVGGFVSVPRQWRAGLTTLLTRRPAVLNPRRIVVAPLENRTGDSSLAPLGAMASDWIAQELMRTGEFEVVDPRTSVTTAAIVARVPRLLRAGDPAVALAEETGAGRLVSGSVYRQGDSLRLQVHLTDVESRRLVREVPIAQGSVRAPAAAVAALGRRTAAALAASVDTAAGAQAGGGGSPPSYQAYREVSGAWESFFRQDRPAFFAGLERAAALDSTYASPLLLLAWGFELERRWDRVEATMQRVARLDSLLTARERALRDVMAAGLAGDIDRRLRAAQSLNQLTPGSVEVPLLVATLAVAANRPRVAIEALDRTDPERGLNLLSDWYWLYRAQALHQLGEYEAELEAGRRARRQFPNSPGARIILVRALAALGRAQDVERELGEVPDGELNVEDPWPAQVALATRELRAHGDSVGAARLRSRALARLEAAIPAQVPPATDTSRAAKVTRVTLGWRGTLLLDARRYAEARRVFAALAADTGDWYNRGSLGLAEAHVGDRAAAARAVAELAALRRPYLFGRNTELRAEISVALGDRAGAVALVRQAYREGAMHVFGGIYSNVHMDPEYAPLRGFAPFDAFATPVH